jgi:tetratricopeptide (TPR) repeat protein
MRPSSKIILVVVLASTFFIFNCNNSNDNSPFREILSQPAFKDITDSIRKEPQNDELYFRRAVLLNKNNFPEPALADLQKAWSLKKEEKYAFGVSTILIDKKPDSAIAFLTQALKEIPNSLLLHLSLARSYDAQNKTDDALKICDAILQQNPEQVDVIKMKAKLLDKKGNKDESIAILEKAYHLTPFDVDLNYILALKYAESKNAKVITLCDSLIKKDSLHLHAEPYYYKGIYYSNINDKAKALALFDETLQHDYLFLDAYIEKGAIFYEQKKYNEALKLFQLLNTISNTFPDAYYWIGKCQQALGQREEALVNYQRAYGLDKTFKEAKDSADKLK